MIPKYPFTVRVTTRNSGGQQHQQSKAFDLVGAAFVYLLAESRKPNVHRCELLMRIEDMAISHDD